MAKVHLRVTPIEYERLHLLAQILADERRAHEFDVTHDPGAKWENGISNLLGESVYKAVTERLAETKTRLVHVDCCEVGVIDDADRVLVKA